MSHLISFALLLLVLLLSNASFRIAAEREAGETNYGETVVVDTKLGRVLGLRDRALGVDAFLGIPFAEPPTGLLRFRPSVPARPWFPASYRAFNFSPECLQSTLLAGEEGNRDEDCLYLNADVDC
jgi:para-nitrobenzyl esterase